MPCSLGIFVLKDWEIGWKILGNGVGAVEVLCIAAFAVLFHLIIGLLIAYVLAIDLLFPPRVSASSVLGLLIDNKGGVDGIGFERTRLVIFSPTIIRLRAFAAGKSVVAGVPPDIDLEELTQLLPGPVQVWNAMDKKRYVAPGVQPTPVGD